MKENKDHLDVLIKLQRNPKQNQRSLAKKLGFSLGKFNYILKSLKDKGYIKVKNFQKNPQRMNYFYYLTPKGFAKKTNLTIKYLERISKEYEEIQKEIKD